MILFKFVSKENLSPPVKKSKKVGIFLLHQLDISCYFELHSFDNSSTDGSFCVVAEVGGISVPFDERKLIAAGVQSLEAGIDSR